MKKISTFIVAVLAICGTTSVKAQSVGEGFTTGYYKMKNTADRTRTYVYNDEFNAVNSKKRSLVSATDAETNNYIWKITNTGNGKISIVNGQGTPLKPEDGAGNGKTFGSHSELTLDDSHSVYPTSVYFTEGIHNPGNADLNHCYGTTDAEKVYAIAYWKGTQGLNSGTCHWAFTAVSAEDDFYTVNITGATNAYVTKTATNEGAYNGGFFKCTEAPTADGFTASSVENYNSNITIDESNKTINVTYTVDFAAFQKVISTAKEVLSLKGVGYPSEESATRATFSAAIDAAVAKTEATLTVADLTTLQTAITTYKADKSSIAMPQDGETYVFTNMHPGGQARYFDYSSDNLVTVVRGTTPVDELPASAKFTCHKLSDSQFMFVNNEGKYLVWKGSSDGTNSRKGYLSSYDANWCPLQVAPTTGEEAFGYFNFGGKRADSKKSYYVVKTDGNFDQADYTQYYNASYSSAFQFEKVSYPNIVTFNAAEGIEGADYISTFSAPFATIKPASVKAYVVKKNSGSEATLEEVDGNIPANQGVVLTSTTEAAVIMVPVAGEGIATIESNLLGHTAGAAKTIAEGENVYVLSKAVGASAVAFNKAKVATTLKMNKAYLTAQSGNAIALNFTSGEVTGISNAIVSGANGNAPIFDLTGRRVMKMTKGGAYIKGGKKIIAQ